MISVIIHEVGHNYFPMIINSDERQWTWMDEGINTFLQFIAEQEWEENFPSRRGEPKNIIAYMVSSDQVPIMTQSAPAAIALGAVVKCPWQSMIMAVSWIGRSGRLEAVLALQCGPLCRGQEREQLTHGRRLGRRRPAPLAAIQRPDGFGVVLFGAGDRKSVV